MRRSLLRTMIKSIAIALKPLMKIFLKLFFEEKYLSGRHFEEGLSGFIWGFQSIWRRNILRLAKPLPFPAAITTYVSDPRNVDFHPDDLNNFQSPGTYFQTFKGRIRLGRGCYIAPNVGIITANHDPMHLDEHLSAEHVEIGEECWVGMNSVILPGVVLGRRTIVGAGSVVTKSFPQGHVVIAGNPARILRDISETGNEGIKQ